MNFVKFLKAPFFIEHIWWLLLQTYRREVISDFFNQFKPFSILNFAMAEWFCHATCFYLILFFSGTNMGVRKMPREKSPTENSFRENCPPQKIVLLDFCYFWHYLPVAPFKNFIVTNFRGVSRTPATSIIDFLVTVVNGINYCRKKLLFRCRRRRTLTSEFIRWNFSMIYISKAHNLSRRLNFCW